MTVKRTLAADVGAQVVAQQTQPFYIVKIEFGGGTQYVSESYEVTFESNVYIEGQVEVGTFKWGPDGTQEGTISLLNENNAASALVLNNTVQDVPVTIYKVYREPAGTFTEPVVYVKGVLSGSQLTPKAALMGVVTSRAETEFAPKDFYTIEDGFNFLPPTGTVVQWAGEKYVLEGEF